MHIIQGLLQVITNLVKFSHSFYVRDLLNNNRPGAMPPRADDIVLFQIHLQEKKRHGVLTTLAADCSGAPPRLRSALCLPCPSSCCGCQSSPWATRHQRNAGNDRTVAVTSMSC